MSFKLSFAWYDIWIGVYVSRKANGPTTIYVCPLPCVLLTFTVGGI